MITIISIIIIDMSIINSSSIIYFYHCYYHYHYLFTLPEEWHLYDASRGRGPPGKEMCSPGVRNGGVG